MGIGLPELMVVFVLAAIYLLPLAAAIWALRAISQIRNSQLLLLSKLDSIEQMIHKTPTNDA